MPPSPAPVTGELAALGAALLWAVASLLYRRIGRSIGAAELNLLKGCVAIPLLLLTITLRGTLALPLEGRPLALLLLSGAIGIGIGDAAYFESLQDLGARRALLVGVLAPPLAGGIGFLLLAETLAPHAWIGIGVALLGVAWVVTEQAPAETGPGARLRRGLLLGLLAAWMQASGAVLSRDALTQSGIDIFWSALLRLAAGGIVMAAYLGLRRAPVGGWLRRPGGGRTALAIVTAAFFGTYLCIVLQQVALRFAKVGIAQTLMSTSPIFILPLAALTGDRVSARAALGALIAVGGVALLFGSAGF
jgi:drug/metabolite transporter (DMT)-like permease